MSSEDRNNVRDVGVFSAFWQEVAERRPLVDVIFLMELGSMAFSADDAFCARLFTLGGRVAGVPAVEAQLLFSEGLPSCSSIRIPFFVPHGAAVVDVVAAPAEGARAQALLLFRRRRCHPFGHGDLRRRRIRRHGRRHRCCLAVAAAAAFRPVLMLMLLLLPVITAALVAVTTASVSAAVSFAITAAAAAVAICKSPREDGRRTFGEKKKIMIEKEKRGEGALYL